MQVRNRIFQCLSLLEIYKGKEPLSQFLKNHFRNHKEMGSRDRKEIRELLYSFFRVGHLPCTDKEDHLLNALYILNGPKHHFLVGSEFQSFPSLESPIERFNYLMEINHWTPFFLDTLPPFSSGISSKYFILSLLQQPKVYAHVHGNRQAFLALLHKHNITYTTHQQLFGFSPQVALNQLQLPKDCYLQIQDKSSYEVKRFFTKTTISTIWDACAGAGGKSLLLLKSFPDAQITASDVRNLSLINLQNRLLASYKNRLKTQLLDATKELPKQSFDLVVADVPCTGSGTWSRTPENYYYFEPSKLGYFTELQWEIAKNCIKAVTDGGYFLYITCSVFEAENETQVSKILAHFSQLQNIKSGIINGTSTDCDSMFATLFKKN